ncbi:MAG: hypothetical protein R2705_11410 [Ilumatobacteraceae bacterium]
MTIRRIGARPGGVRFTVTVGIGLLVLGACGGSRQPHDRGLLGIRGATAGDTADDTAAAGHAAVRQRPGARPASAPRCTSDGVHQQPRPASGRRAAGEHPTYYAQTGLPDGWSVMCDPDYEQTELVACVDRTATTAADLCEGYESDGEATDHKVQTYGATYEIKVVAGGLGRGAPQRDHRGPERALPDLRDVLRRRGDHRLVRLDDGSDRGDRGPLRRPAGLNPGATFERDTRPAGAVGRTNYRRGCALPTPRRSTI